MINTLALAKKLEEVGVTREHAEAHMQVLAEVVGGQLATKEDIKILEVHSKAFESATKQDFKNLEDRFVKWNYALMASYKPLNTDCLLNCAVPWRV